MSKKIELFCCGLSCPLAIDRMPELSWKVTGAGENYRQASWQVETAARPELLGADNLWDSGTVQSAINVCTIQSPFCMEDSTRYWWRVTVTDTNGESLTSEPSWFETGILSEQGWTARFIGAGNRYITNWGLLFRKEFELSGEIEYAKAYISGLGCCELRMNGKKAGDHYLDPAQTEYFQKIFYSAYDVTALLHTGTNAVGVMLGDGWYHQSQLMEGGGNYGEPCLLFQLEVRYADGRTDRVVSDTDWTAALSPITYNNIYAGETYDARLEQPGFDLPGFGENGCGGNAHGTADREGKDCDCIGSGRSSWFAAEADKEKKGTLCSQLMPPIRITREIRPVSVTEPQSGIFVFDMGENMAGAVRLTAPGFPGNEITMRFAEAIDENGMPDYDSSGVFHFRNVQTLRYLCREEKEICWQPRFTYLGFRYVELTGVHAPVTQEMLTGLKIHTDLKETSDFHCSMPILNQMHRMFKNTFTSNIHGLPTDCPAREKCGWTGDANIISDTSMILWDADLFWDKYIDDIVCSYREYGEYHNVVPGRRGCLDTVPAWGSALVTIPWNHYQAYGKVSVLEKYYEDMKEYVSYMEAHTENCIYQDHPYRLADWAAPYGYDSGSHYFQISTAYYYASLRIMARTAEILKREEDRERYEKLAVQVKESFSAKFYDESEHTYGTQTLNSFCAELGLYPDGEKAAMAAWCVKDAQEHGWHITCGHIGIRFIYRLLTEFGYFEELEKLLNSRTYPSFGAQIDRGATTLWETFELSVHNQSLNHPFKGSYCLWLYEDVLGIKKTSPGYETFRIKPLAAELVEQAEGFVDTGYGRIEVRYQIDEYFEVKIPENTAAEVFVPQKNGGFLEYSLGSGTYSLL